jgi:hypothetical protein
MPITNTPDRTGYFAETAAGAVVLTSLQFLSLPILIGGLALIGAAKMISRHRHAR